MPLVATLFHLQTDLTPLLSFLESQPPSGLCLTVCTEWLEKGELFNFKCFNKAKEMSIENTSLKFCARTVGPHTLCLGGWEVAGGWLCDGVLGTAFQDAHSRTVYAADLAGLLGPAHF